MNILSFSFSDLNVSAWLHYQSSFSYQDIPSCGSAILTEDGRIIRCRLCDLRRSLHGGGCLRICLSLMRLIKRIGLSVRGMFKGENALTERLRSICAIPHRNSQSSGTAATAEARKEDSVTESPFIGSILTEGLQIVYGFLLLALFFDDILFCVVLQHKSEGTVTAALEVRFKLRACGNAIPNNNVGIIGCNDINAVSVFKGILQSVAGFPIGSCYQDT